MAVALRAVSARRVERTVELVGRLLGGKEDARFTPSQRLHAALQMLSPPTKKVETDWQLAQYYAAEKAGDGPSAGRAIEAITSLVGRAPLRKLLEAFGFE